MNTWFSDEQWLDDFAPWLMPTSLQFIQNNNNTQFQAFGDYAYPTIERLTPTYMDNSIFDFYKLYSDRSSIILNNFSNGNKIKRTFNREYQIFYCLGKGGFGQVYDGQRRTDNSPVVVKFLPKDRILNWGTFEGERVPYEIEILWRLRGVSGVIKILEHFEEVDRFIFIMEKIPNSCTLFDLVMETSPLANTELLRHLFREIIRINITLQMYGVWHRDCKPENIIYCKNDRSLRVIDFGSAAPVQSEDFHEFQGTLEIMVPEWILQRRYNGEKACVWALGVCLYFLIYQQYPFRSKTDIIKGRLNLPYLSSIDKDIYHTMKQCMNVNENRRPKLNNLQFLSWLKTIY
ncbi:unnamed protein product [Rotaria sordida]|uniref:non-specific serine/threonine protein kinase n=1 Tax=Rotaria sordida TaxID=392033 RepID=A0A818R989_9BILA|nr:unnamed protein product [Rotaria sordida]CAF0750180.1 unnamed protein product [Rotaria sordida]CAF0788631.1 unnamed protein product [Rotaria sordida]CAF0853350.1 unnamed protein product [Rotaria sordida]CAF0899167.1 unnamed protein product [Rotaria sordida]